MRVLILFLAAMIMANLPNMAMAQREPKLVISNGFDGTFVRIEINQITVFQDSVSKDRDPLAPIAALKLPSKDFNYIQIYANQEEIISIPINMKMLRRKSILLVEAITFENKILRVWFNIMSQKEKIPL